MAAGGVGRWDDKAPGDGTPPSRRDSDGLSDRWAFSLGAMGLEVEVEEGEGGGDAVEAPGELPPPWVSEAMEKAYWMGQVDARQKRKGSRSSRSLPRARARSVMGSESTRGYEELSRSAGVSE